MSADKRPDQHIEEAQQHIADAAAATLGSNDETYQLAAAQAKALVAIAKLLSQR